MHTSDTPPLCKKAVAVGYTQGEQAPRLLARGQGAQAEFMLRLAREYGIPVHEDRDIVEIMETLGDGAYIPEELYQAFATLLASLYRAGTTRQNNEG